MTVRYSHPLSKGYAPLWASAWGQDRFGPWVALSMGGVEQRLRWIPPGRFWMGSTADEEGHEEAYDGPRHQVRLTSGFWLFDTPCTQALWQAVMGENPSQFKGDNRPVEGVSWEDCQAFLDKLNAELPDLSLRLPTDAQWEYACRARTETARYEEELEAIAWYAANSSGETHEVKQKRPNTWGLYDMLGNVWEWCHDGPRNDEAGLVVDPVGPIDAGADRVSRGGGWHAPARLVRAASRDWYGPGIRGGSLGFRCLSSVVSQ